MLPSTAAEELDDLQHTAVATLTGPASLVVVEGAAGAGKTTTLAATKVLLAERARRMLVVTPTLKAAQVAAREVGTAGSAAWLVHQHGFRWDAHGRWTRVAADPTSAAVLGRGDLLLVDEAGMLDQDTARALLTVADEMGARVALVGDRHQLPAVGRGGVLDLAVRWVPPEAHLDLDVAHRFADPEYAEISLALRTGSPTYTVPPGTPDGERVGEVWEALWRRGQIRIYPSEAERTQALAQLAAEAVHARETGPGTTLVMGDTGEQTTALNGAIRDRLVAAGHLDDTHGIVTKSGERLGIGDRVATRSNDRDLGVTNRDTWTITALGADGNITLRGRTATDLRTIPASYARQHVELAYASTVYGAQGETTTTAHLVLGEHTSAASAYVAMTRGRDSNIAHLVAEDEAAARAQWAEVFARDRADLGPAAAAEQAAEDIEHYGTQTPARPLEEVLADLRSAWSRQADLHDHHQRLVDERETLRQVAAIHARYTPGLDRLGREETSARRDWLQARHRVENLDTALEAETADVRARIWSAWHDELSQARRAADIVGDGTGRLGQRRRQVHEAQAELTEFAARWHPAVPDLPTDPADLAAQVRWLHGRRVAGAIDAFVAHQVANTHPDADQIRQAERDAYAAHEHAQRSRSQLENAMAADLRPHGRAARVRDADGRLTAVADELADVEQELRTATARVQALATDPSIRTFPGEGLQGEHDRWAADRLARQQASARQARERWQRRQEGTRRIEPPSPGPTGPDRGLGIGR